MTRERAADECWMATEKGHADMPLDKRADIVDKCIDDKLSGKKTAAVAPEKSKAKPAPEIKPKSDKANGRDHAPSEPQAEAQSEDG